MWWHPSLCADERIWTVGKSEELVEFTLMEEAPDADRICVAVTAREYISMTWAANYQYGQFVY